MWIYLLLCLFACRHNQNTAPSVAKIKFEGNSHSFSSSSDYVLRSVIEQEKNELFVFLNRQERVKFYQPETVRLDAWRLENWYATQGYIDAKFIGWEMHYLPQRWWHSNPRVQLTGYLEEGEPVYIRSVQWEGKSKNILQRELEKKLYFDVGQPLLLSAIEATEADLLSLFHNRSYARATVDIVAEIWPENCYELEDEVGLCLQAQVRASCVQNKDKICKEIEPILEQCEDDWCRRETVERYSQFITKGKNEAADIIIRVNEGESCTFGDVLWFSDSTVPFDVLKDQVPFSKGQAYKSKKISKLQQRLFSLSQFSVVTVTPDLSQEGKEIPILVNLTARKPQQMQVGLGGELEDGAWAANGSVEYSHTNLLNKLLQLQWSNKLGYAYYTNSLDGVTGTTLTDLQDFLGFGGPIIESNLELNYPRFIRPTWAIGFEIDYQMGVEPSFRYSEPRLSPFFSWKKPLQRSIFSSIDARFSYSFTDITYLDSIIPIEELESAQLGLDQQNQVSVGYLGQEIILDGRNDPLNTKRGVYAATDLYWANQIFGGDYDYWQVNTDFRYFYSLFELGNAKIPLTDLTIRRWRLKRGKKPREIDGVIALRSASGAFMPYQATEDANFAPSAKHFYLGGTNDVRGWRTNLLGPYICEVEGCVVDGVQQNTDVLPIGGKASWVGSVEYRQYFMQEYGVTFFMDAGMVWDRVSSIQISDIQPSAGVGLRYISPIGPIRFDYACRLKEDQLFQAEDRCQPHFAFSEAY